jgi:putative membrane protein
MQEVSYYAEFAPAYLIYMGVGLALLVAAVTLYALVTPYHEVKLIRAGNATAALSLTGMVLGQAIAISAAVRYAISIPDLVMWGVTALLFQLLCFFAVRLVLPNLKQGIETNTLSYGILLGGSSIAVGLINAACLTPPPT